jgi:uncharacterized protein (TIRG00374 family)
MPKHQAGNIRRHLATVVKLLIAAGLVAGLFFYHVITLDALRTTFRDPPIAASAFAVLLLGYVLSAARWYFLLRAMGIYVRLRPCAEIFAMGTFANTFLPGGTGGDLVRAVYIARHVHQDRAGGVISVFADRAIGLLGVVMVALVLALVAPEHVIASPLTHTFFLVLVGAFAAAIAGIVAAFVVVSPGRLARIETFVGSRTILHRLMLRLFQAVVQLRSDPWAVLLSFAISIVVTLTIVASVVLLAHGYEGGGLRAVDFGNAAVLAILANAVPITPGGIGIAEGAFAFLCYAWEVTPTALPYGTIFFGYRLILTVISLIGSVAFVSYRGTVARGPTAAELG